MGSTQCSEAGAERLFGFGNLPGQQTNRRIVRHRSGVRKHGLSFDRSAAVGERLSDTNLGRDHGRMIRLQLGLTKLKSSAEQGLGLRGVAGQFTCKARVEQHS